MRVLLRWLLFFASLYIGCKVIRYLGGLYASQIDGYRRGNRHRIVSIAWLQWIMLHLDLIVYTHLFSPFSQVQRTSKAANEEGNEREKISFIEQQPAFTRNYGAKRVLCRRLFAVYLLLTVFSHTSYLLYLVEDFTVPWFVVDLIGLCGGIWLNLTAFAVFFTAANALLLLVKIIKCGKHSLAKFGDALGINTLSDSRLQVTITLIGTAFLCLLHWYSAGRLIVKELEFPLQAGSTSAIGQLNYSQKKEIKAVLITDLHGGASVYREQIAGVVDRTNALDPDVIFIVGDVIDAPRARIEERMEPLRQLRAPLGVFFTTGNHDYYYGNVEEWIELFEGSYGIRTLINERVELKDSAICLVGLNDISAGRSGVHSKNMSALGECPPHEPIVVLAHNPAAAEEIIAYATGVNRTVNLILSGHTHAAQYYAMVPYIYWLLPYFYGVYDLNEGRTKLLVSAGTLYSGAPMKMPRMSELWLLRFKY